MEPNNQGQWMSIGEAAKYLNISRDTLRRWEKKGKIKPVRSPTNRRYYTKKQLEELMSRKSEPKIYQEAAPSQVASPKKLSLNKKKLKIILAGVISFLVTAAIAVAIIYFILK